MGHQTGGQELAAMRAEFACLRRRWCLGTQETAALLATDRTPGGEEAMRLLLELDRVMRILLGDDEVVSWLRLAGPQGLSPLQFLTLGHDERRAMLAASRLRHRQIVGCDA